MRMDRRSFLRGLVGTAAGVLVAPEVLADPERRVWALDNTMVRPVHDTSAHMRLLPEWIDKLARHDTPPLDMITDDNYNYYQRFHWGFNYGDVIRVNDELMWVGRDQIHRAQAGTSRGNHGPDSAAQLVGIAKPWRDW